MTSPRKGSACATPCRAKYKPGSYELFDLGTDPRELRNVIRGQTAQAKPLIEALRGWTSRPVTAPSPGTVSEDAAKRLEALGYVQ